MFSIALLILNAIVFRDLTSANLLFRRFELCDLRGDQLDHRQLAFDSFSQAHAIRKANERFRRRRNAVDPDGDRACACRPWSRLSLVTSREACSMNTDAGGAGLGFGWVFTS